MYYEKTRYQLSYEKISLNYLYSCTANAIWNLSWNTEEQDRGANFDEKSMAISGFIPLLLELNGVPIWGNKDRNSPLAFRPTNYRMEVSFSRKLLLEVYNKMSYI